MRRKTSIYLGDRESEHLAHLSRLEGRSVADIIRAAILAYRGKHERRVFHSEAVGSGPGGSIADVPEEELMRGFGE